jgi:hypothetical protein
MNEKINFCLAETYKHVKKVQKNLNLFITDLIRRGENHDNSKFEEPELTIFAEYTPLMADVKFGSPEYEGLKDKTKIAREHHYSKNRHHPEFWPHSIDDMTLVDLIELLADWKAATERNKDGNIRKSIEINAVKYKISPQLKQIFENTIREYFKE